MVARIIESMQKEAEEEDDDSEDMIRLWISTDES